MSQQLDEAALERPTHWTGLMRLNQQLPWPRRWSDRFDGWMAGGIFRMDWSNGGSWDECSGSPGKIPLTERALEKPALIGPDRAGLLWAFSFDAVKQAMSLWEFYGLKRLYHFAWYISWLNGIHSRNDGIIGFAAPSGYQGLDVMDCGAFHLVFCPQVLGPMGTLDETGFQPSRGLQYRPVTGGIRLRGTALTDGLWRSGRVEPLKGHGGWFFLPIKV